MKIILLFIIYIGEINKVKTKPGEKIHLVGGEDISSQDIKRICLFAGYDPDGLIDDTAVEYIKELSKFSDIYYMADNPVLDTEFSKIEPYVKGAWGIRHRSYDFGSWSLLAKKYVGWDKIKEYDELLFVNDSCYLMHPLDDLFSSMSQAKCHWWGLQSTKGLYRTINRQGVKEEISLEDVKKEYLSKFELQDPYDFLVGSYFLAFRKTIMSDENFISIIENIFSEENKARTIARYEVGLTRWLISKNYNFTCFFNMVEPFQPVFTNFAFDMIANGFPILKRYFLSNNHYNETGIEIWERKIKKAGIDKDLSIYRNNLYRTSNSEKYYSLYGNILEETEEVKTLSARKIDEEAPKYDNWWGFPVCAFNNGLNDNTRAMFEFVKNNPNIKKIIFSRKKNIKVDGNNVLVVPLKSPEGLFYIARCKHIFLKHTIKSNVFWELDPQKHNFYNLWHGIPLKKIHYVSNDRLHLAKRTEKENRSLSAVISASNVDRLAMTAAFWPLTFHDVWLTGLPRHDFITCAEESLPSDFYKELCNLKNVLRDRKLILFAPTFRNDQENGYYNFSKDEIDQLSALLKENNCVLGIREHMADTSGTYGSVFVGETFINLTESIFKNVEIVLRCSDIVITDYSSCFIDFLLTGRPVISFAFDRDSYLNERGMFYDLDWCFPGPVVTEFPDLIQSLDSALNGTFDRDMYNQKRSIFLEYMDSKNSNRVYNKILEYNNEITIEKNTKGKVVFVYNHDDIDSYIFRVLSFVYIMRKNGYICEMYNDKQISRNVVRGCSFLFMNNVSISKNIVDLMQEAKFGGATVVYDTEASILEDIDYNDISYCSLSDEDVIRVINERKKRLVCMNEADVVTVNSKNLSEDLSNKNIRNVFVGDYSPTKTCKNNISNERKEEDNINICYFAGYTSDPLDFMECCDAINRISSEFKNVKFSIVGKKDYRKYFEENVSADFIDRDTMSKKSYGDIVSNYDINILPMRDNVYNRCLGSTLVQEAAKCGVVTVASMIGPFPTIISDKNDGFLVKDNILWYDTLKEIVSDKSIIKYCSNNAKNKYLDPMVEHNFSEEVLSVFKMH